MKIIHNFLGRAHQRLAMIAALCLFGVSATAPGQQIHRNDEFGIQATFPAGSRVCEARSGDHPHGFYARYGGRQMPCGDRNADRLTTAIGIYASYNTSFEPSPIAELRCPNGALPRGIAIDLRGLSFPRLNSVRCGLRRKDGSIELMVAAQAGDWGPGATAPEFATPSINYSASLITRPEHLQRDLAMFRQFLSQMVIRAGDPGDRPRRRNQP